jgi:hypothetical protein
LETNYPAPVGKSCCRLSPLNSIYMNREDLLKTISNPKAPGSI